ncbi:MAG: Xaa-Pro peptidase family protein [Armatimonadota bacterium]|nr:Xaa-Pro peptidase family protein [Armatimonadota bacterium]MDR7388704.1 Xaa-Pro peptidase family protein [Armatimonadota bacterium]MDR7391241.1 Xaa-Pro peptidase family protein [Armatimonadota bacterium]MDR7394444.1 Xaa-Pro peptidase family protein [Armatimonadota bacterium]MDR7397066.1 Xaa-Pro peptidase family protein [Armatimonadota bacterium]
MRSDLDRLMEERGLDALVVAGRADEANMLYVLRGVAIPGAIYVKKRGHPGVLCHGTMERGEAERTGLRTRNLGLYDWKELLQKAGGDPLEARVLLFQRVFQDEDVRGRVAFYGEVDQGVAYRFLGRLAACLEGIEVVGEYGRSVLAVARETKDPDELEKIREVGAATQRVVQKTEQFLRSCPARDGLLHKPDGSVLTVGDVKARVRVWLAEEGLEDSGTIFSQGRDAGLPHSRGDDRAPVTAGVPVVFDIFPRPSGGGYHFDMTRTWCVGNPSAEALQVYRDVYECYARVTEALRPGVRCADLQRMACEFFESRGHPTVCSDPTAQVGYVHSLGHGLGLDVHEEPRLSDHPGNEAVLRPGVVVTVEPGLYYPDQGIGVRLEDVWAITEDGAVNLGGYPMDLVLRS